MTLQQLETDLKQLCPDTYKTAAPRKLTRFITWHQYNREAIRGNDRTALSLPKIQIDVYWQQRGDLLLDGVLMLLETFGAIYTLEDVTFDDELQRHRAIIQAVIL